MFQLRRGRAADPDLPASRSPHGVNAVVELVEPLLRTPAVRRLSGITFLGLLSPRLCDPHAVSDGTRADHSLGVASIMIGVARQLGLSLPAQRYAAAWGLLHDIATWPFSHTSEPAFARLTGVSSRRLREMIILGDPELPTELCVSAALLEAGVDPGQLVSLFQRSTRDGPLELRLLSQVIHSRITPDTLEGIHRAGLAYGIQVPSPDATSRVFRRSLFETTVDTRDMKTLHHFWTSKGRVYDHHINSWSAVRHESLWSTAIERALGKLSLAASLFLTEAEVYRSVQQFEFPFSSVMARYKAPIAYRFCVGVARRLKGEVPVSALADVFLKIETGRPNERSQLPRSPRSHRSRAMAQDIPKCI